MAASGASRRERVSPSCATPKPSAVASAASCGAIPHALASTSPGKLAVPTAWEKKASRRRTIQVPEHAGGDGEQQHLEQRALDVRGAEVHQGAGRQERAPPVRPSTMAAVFAAIEPT